MAFGPLSLSCDEFWSLTPAEIFDLAEGYRERYDTQMHIVAWHAANVMNVHTKKQVTVDKLLGKKKEMSPLDRESEVEKLRVALAERRMKNGN
jgi:hypothetical protein